MTDVPIPIAVFVENLEKLRFFARLALALAGRSYRLSIISQRLSVINRARRLGLNFRPCRRVYMDIDVSNTLEYLSGDLNERQCRELYGGVTQALQEAASTSGIAGAFVWNGGRVADKAVVDFCNGNGLDLLFFEIGNIPGKMIADPMGVNARSLLAKHGFVQAETEPDDEGFNNWKANYIQAKLVQKSVPQAASIGRINYSYLVDLLGFILLRLPRSNSKSVLALLQAVFTTNRASLSFSNEMPASCYYFLPLQVTNDTQLYLNSKVDNRAALEHAISRCRQDNMALVVKPHPAEKSADFLAWLDEYAQRERIVLSQHNTMALIEKSELVITINSTVGLEALLCGRPIEVLGEAVYRHFTAQDLALYVNNYLLDIDYFSDTAISDAAIEEILLRLTTGSVAGVNAQ